MDKMSSLLLDIDHRYVRNTTSIDTTHESILHVLITLSLSLSLQAQFYSPDYFKRFNMFNSFFYSSNGEEICQSFLSHVADSKTAIVIDPPFGGLAEVLARGVKHLWDITKQGKLFIFIVAPHFLYIIQNFF